MIRRGKEKGKRGTVKAVFPKAGAATVEGMNVVKRHTKPGQAGQQSGGIFEKEAPIPIGALMYRLREVQHADAASPRPQRRRHQRNGSAEVRRARP